MLLLLLSAEIGGAFVVAAVVVGSGGWQTIMAAVEVTFSGDS